MAGIYIHIPFCKQKCHYCNFYSLASIKYRDVFVDALIKEIALQKDYLYGEDIETIYFGGGTPSLLSSDEITRIIDELALFHNIKKDAEITLEANPDDITKGKIAEIKKTPVNRFSIGIQSFFDDDLRYLNRVHSGSEAEFSVKTVLDAGYENMSIDLIYGIPTLSNEQWQANIEKFYSFNIPHLSSYALTVEPKTALDVLIKKEKMKNVDEEKAVQQFRFLMQTMNENDFIHYEISNFSRKGFYSKHNTSYWQGKKYLGLGPSAHSFDGNSRQWNISNLSKYLKATNKGGIIVERETLTKEQKYNEYVMTSLRTIWGTNTEYILKEFGKPFENHYIKEVEKHKKAGFIVQDSSVFRLTDSGKIFADGIASDLFI
jgi:oxygen-independent coproporphyrinogen-3 oxidase